MFRLSLIIFSVRAFEVHQEATGHGQSKASIRLRIDNCNCCATNGFFLFFRDAGAMGGG